MNDSPCTVRQAAVRARQSFLQACALDVAVQKPGNVSLKSPGHRMHAAQFISSAAAAAGPLCEAGARVGRRIENAVAASWAAVGCNTNLGIVLLCAPLAAAAERSGAMASVAAFSQALEAVLQELDLDDSRCAFRAIAAANPAGLGAHAQEDVRSAPSLGLRQAMALAAPRDSVARQYDQGFTDLLALDWPLLPEVSDTHAASTPPLEPTLTAAVQHLYLQILARWPDSHIVRKHGLPAAQLVSAQARLWLPHPQPEQAPGFAQWDQQLKADGLNPGTSADLTVATLMWAGLLTPAATAWHGS